MTYRLTILILSCLFSLEASAQQLSQVVEKVVQWERELKDVKVLDLHSEKAEVFISRGEPGKISVKLIYTTSHADRAIAEAEMRFHHYVVGPKGNTFFVYQGYQFKNVTKVFSKLTARVELVIPPDMEVIAVGDYADFNIRNGNGTNEFRMHFGKLILNNVNGTTKVNTNYGDIEINQCTGKINIEAKRSDILLKLADPISKGFIQTIGKEQIVDTLNFYIKNTLGTIEVENSMP